MLLRGIAPVEASPLEWCELPDPDPEPGVGEIRLQVHCCAICRTDLHVLEGDLAPQRRPLILGHQIVGVVDRPGPECSRFRPGDRVGVAWLRSTCGACRFCSSGRENLCESPRFTGHHEHGGFAEMAVVPEAFAYRLSMTFDDLSAAPLLCAGIIGYRALMRSGVRHGGSLAIYGFGSSAHVVLQPALSRGCDVYVVTRGAGHRHLAREMGATWVGDSTEAPPARVESAILFAPAGELVPSALAQLDRGGTLAIAGIHLSDIPVLRYESQLFYEKSLCSVTANTREDGSQLLQEAASIGLQPRVTQYPLKEANRALQDLKADRINGTGVLVAR